MINLKLKIFLNENLKKRIKGNNKDMIKNVLFVNAKIVKQSN